MLVVKLLIIIIFYKIPVSERANIFLTFIHNVYTVYCSTLICNIYIIHIHIHTLFYLRHNIWLHQIQIEYTCDYIIICGGENGGYVKGEGRKMENCHQQKQMEVKLVKQKLCVCVCCCTTRVHKTLYIRFVREYTGIYLYVCVCCVYVKGSRDKHILWLFA